MDGYYHLRVQRKRGLVFRGKNERSESAAEALERSFRVLAERLEHHPLAAKVLEDFSSGADGEGMPIFSHEALPGAATRETRFGEDLTQGDARLVVNTTLLHRCVSGAGSLNKDGDVELLGQMWPVLGALLLQLGQPAYPRDRFIDRIRTTARWCLLGLVGLYEGKRDGRLVPNAGGKRFQDHWLAAPAKDFVREQELQLLENTSFLLNPRLGEDALEAAEIIVRDDLDSRYLRLGVASIMPGRPLLMLPMPDPKSRERNPKPEIGRFGILDKEDLEAWNKVRKGLADLGFPIVAQLGMGQFGRVYEAVNHANPALPDRVAIKVDRFRKGRKKEAIEAAETIMDTARGLSRSPHVIRVFDAGKIKSTRATYHVLQLVDGDTLDNLIGTTGLEHASILRPKSSRSSPEEARKVFLSSVQASEGERWRRERQSVPFVRKPSLRELLDILVSKVLWVEEVHRLGFAVNDLKNGNVMVNRRGLLKGIDLDAYSHAFSPHDKLADFFFLGTSALQILEGELFSGQAASEASNSDKLTAWLEEKWSHGDVGEESQGRVSTAEAIRFFSLFVRDARSGVFAGDPERFSSSIDALIRIKRFLSDDEIVVQ